MTPQKNELTVAAENELGHTTGSRRASVAVLGLGRMGMAIATRLTTKGYLVTPWSRTVRPFPNLTMSPDPAAAASDADVVLVALYDADACREVFARLAPNLRPGTPVINMSTVGIDEAVELAELIQSAGARYFHAPVLGSVPAVLGGTLRIIMGAQRDGVPDSVTELLGHLGTLIQLTSASEAAAAKLLANGVLADEIYVVCDGVARAAELGLDGEEALAILEETLVGPLVVNKRRRLSTRDFSAADFTVAALAKDLELLAGAAPSARGVVRRVDSALFARQVDPDDDVAALCLPRPAFDLGHRLTCAQGVNVPPDVLAPLIAYVKAHATGNARYHRAAFAADARIEGHRDGAYVSWSLNEYCEMFTGEPAADETTRTRRIDGVFVAGEVATARMTLDHGAFSFDDLFLLIRHDGEWRIANKVFRRSAAA